MALTAYLIQAARFTELLGEFTLIKVGASGTVFVNQLSIEQFRPGQFIQLKCPRAGEHYHGYCTYKPIRVHRTAGYIDHKCLDPLFFKDLFNAFAGSGIWLGGGNSSESGTCSEGDCQQGICPKFFNTVHDGQMFAVFLTDTSVGTSFSGRNGSFYN